MSRPYSRSKPQVGPPQRTPGETFEIIQNTSAPDASIPLDSKCIYFSAMFLPPIVFQIMLHYSHDLIASNMALLGIFCAVLILSIHNSDAPTPKGLYWMDYLETELQTSPLGTKTLKKGSLFIMVFSLVPYFLFKWTSFPDFQTWYFPFGNFYAYYPKISALAMLYYSVGMFCIQNGVAQSIMFYAVIYICKFKRSHWVKLTGAIAQTLMNVSLWWSFSRSWEFVAGVGIVSFLVHLHRYFLIEREGFVVAGVNMVCYNVGQLFFCVLVFWRLENLDPTKSVVMDPENVWTNLFGL